MSRNASKDQVKHKKIEFSFYAPQANEVLLLGDFNQWNGKKHNMKKKDDGAWKKTLKLTPGTYEYKYLVDCNWQEDTSNHQVKPNSFGTYNNVMAVLE